MTVAEYIELGVGLVTAVTAVISVLIAVKTLRQNNKMIRNSSRPYIAVSFQSTNFQSISVYVVIKNYGASGAVIKSLEFSEKLVGVSVSGNWAPPFEGINGTFLAPGQSIVCAIDTAELRSNNVECLKATVAYSDGINNYIDDYPLNYGVYGKNPSVRANTKGNELSIISYTLQDLVEKHL